MSVTITVPLLNGDGSPAKISLQLPTTAPAGTVTWSSGTPATGTVTPSNDGQSVLFTPLAAGSTVITSTITQGPNGLSTTWEPGHLYRVGDEIVDQHGNVQKVTSANKLIPSTFTPYAGAVPNSPSISLSGGSASSNTYGVVAITGISATVPTTWAVGDSITIAGATSSTLDGLWIISAIGTNSISIDGYKGITLSSVSQTSGTVSNTTRGGDYSYLINEDSGADLVGAYHQFGTVLNQGDGTNGDWPAGAMAANSGNIVKPYPTTPAAVGFIAAGYSTGRNVAGVDNGPAGIDSPLAVTAWQPAVSYAEGFRIVDENGNIQQVLHPGISGTQYPAFSTSGTTTDGTVTWNYISAAILGFSNDAAYLQTMPFSEIGDNALGTFAVTGVTVTGNTAVYAGTFPTSAGSNGWAGYAFTIAGFVTHPANNGNFVCVASTTTTLTFITKGATESQAGTVTNSGLRAYLDLEGNVHIGWQAAGGTVTFAEPNSVPPPFGTSTTVDGDLVWTYQAAAALTTVYSGLTLTVSSAAGIQPVPWNYLIVQ